MNGTAFHGGRFETTTRFCGTPTVSDEVPSSMSRDEISFRQLKKFGTLSSVRVSSPTSVNAKAGSLRETPRSKSIDLPRLMRSESTPMAEHAHKKTLTASPRVATRASIHFSAWDTEEVGYEEQDNLRWVEIQTSKRQRCVEVLHQTGGDKVWDGLQALFSITAATIFIFETYDDQLYSLEGVILLELVIGTFFLLEYFLDIFVAENRTKFIFSFVSLVDITSLVPIVVDFVLYVEHVNNVNAAAELDKNLAGVNVTMTSSETVEAIAIFDPGVLRFIRALKVFRILQSWRVVQRIFVHHRQRHIRILYLVMCVMFCCAGIFLQIEHEQKLGFFEALYFYVITFTTVGYGDVKPNTVTGQIFIMCTLILTIFLLPQQIEKLRAIRRYTRKNMKIFKNTTRGEGHILLCGNLSARALLTFLHEIYGDAHGKQELPLCILSPEKASPQIKSIVRGHWLRDRVSLLIGSTLVESDLQRARIHDAHACFIIADREAENSAQEDAAVVLGSTVVRKLNPEIEIFASVIDGMKHLQRLRWAIGDNGECFAVGMMKQYMVASNIICPGAIPLLANMLRSYANRVIESDVLENACLEYQWGMSFQIYPMALTTAFHGIDFGTAARITYSQFGIMMLGFARDNRICLNPAKKKLKMGEIGFFLARSVAQLKAIETKFGQAAAFFEQSDDSGTHRMPDSKSPKGEASNWDVVKSKFLSQKNQTLSYRIEGTKINLRRTTNSLTHFKADEPMQRHGVDSIFFESSPMRQKSEATTHDGDPAVHVQGEAASMTNFELTKKSKSRILRSRSSQHFQFHNSFLGLQYRREELHMEDEERNVDEVVVTEVPFEGHIILACPGKIGDIIHTISRLRIKTLKLRCIVVMTKAAPSSKELRKISRFKDVYLFQGDPCDLTDLIRAGFHVAHHCAILSAESVSKNPSIKKTKHHGQNDEIFETSGNNVMETLDNGDYDRVTLLLGIFEETRLLSGVTTEILNEANMRFARPAYKRGSKEIASPFEILYHGFFRECAHFMSPVFAAGHMFHGGIVDRAVAQSWYNPYIISVFRTLLGADGGEISIKESNLPESEPKSERNSSNRVDVSAQPLLNHVVIPEKFVSMPFVAVFDYLVKTKNELPLAIYRRHSMTKSGHLSYNSDFTSEFRQGNTAVPHRTPYVYTCPSRDAVVEKGDTIIVLSKPFEDHCVK